MNKTKSKKGKGFPEKKTRPRKFRWHSPEGHQLTAGGIIPYDENGIWIIKEYGRKGFEWADMGGKYKFEDCDIYKTIAREFSEEVYHSSELTRAQMEFLCHLHHPIYVDNNRGQPVYVCYAVPTSTLSQHGVEMNPELFLFLRDEAVRTNPHVPIEYYSSVELRHVSYDTLRNILSPGRSRNFRTHGDDDFILSHRLKIILSQYFPHFRFNDNMLRPPVQIKKDSTYPRTILKRDGVWKNGQCDIDNHLSVLATRMAMFVLDGE